MRWENYTVMLLGWSPGPTEFAVLGMVIIILALRRRDGDR